MNDLLVQCVNMMDAGKFDFCICGGYALELYINKTIRPHSDLDICIFEDNKDDFIRFMFDQGWFIYEPLNNGLIRLITNPNDHQVEQICVFCIKPDCSFIEMKPVGDNLFKMNILNSEQLDFDFIEVIFNPRENGKFVYAQNHNITRNLNKAILRNDKGIPYMSPELVLFCKSIYISRDGYQKDFDVTVPFLSSESKEWLINALKTSYPNGHQWLGQLG